MSNVTPVGRGRPSQNHAGRRQRMGLRSSGRKAEAGQAEAGCWDLRQSLYRSASCAITSTPEPKKLEDIGPLIYDALLG